MKILFIEDEPEMAASISGYLSEDGHHVETLKDAMEKIGRVRIRLHFRGFPDRSFYD